MLVDRLGQLRLDERRDRAVEDDREARVLDVPAHDPQRVGPELLGRAGDPREAVLAAGDDGRRGAVAEQGGGDDRGGIVAVEADRDRAGLDGDEQPVAARDRPPPAARRATRPLTPPAQPRPKTGTRRTSSRRPTRWADARFEAGRGDAGGRDGDDAVDLVGRQPGLARSPRSRPRRTAARRLRDRRRCGRASRAAARYQSGGATMWRRAIPALSNTPDSRSNRAFLPPNASRPSSLASACSMTCGGTAVASESKLQGCIMPLTAVRTRLWFTDT